MLANATERRHEETEMRKIRNPQLQSANPGLLFARGVEQLVSDGLYRPSSSDTQNLRREAPAAKTVKTSNEGNFFSAFLRQYVF